MKTSSPTTHLSHAEQFAQRVIDEFNLDKHLDESSLLKMREELIKKYNDYSPYLDSKFLSNMLSSDKNQVTTGLWELIMVDRLMKSQLINSISHDDKGPDWKITLQNGGEFYVEATCALLPRESEHSEIHRVIKELKEKNKSSYGSLLEQEAKSRISNSIDAKLKKHGAFMQNKKLGYLLVISYGNLPLFSTCDLYQAAQTIYPFGNLTLKLAVDHQNNPEIADQYLEYQGGYSKPSSPSAMINTDIFGNQAYNWVSAILISKIETCLLLEQAENLPSINWGDKKNDFVLIHNPAALYPLSEDIFNSATQIKIENGGLRVKGKNIFPVIGS